MSKLPFSSDYMRGMHPKVAARLMSVQEDSFDGYGMDWLTMQAKDKIRTACQCPDADVYFLVGGTQSNAIVITALLRPYEAVIAAASGHIAVHEAGAIEHNGHKVITLPQVAGKLTAENLKAYLKTFYSDETHDHMPQPGMVYLSQPTECGTLYSLSELTAIREICSSYHLSLYVDGARLAYALACPENDVTLPDLAKLCDVFYIGGTKCGAMFGEAVVIPDPSLLPHFFTLIKQGGGLLAKGWLLGVQFDALFTDHLYDEIGKTAIQAASRLRQAFSEAGWPFWFDSPTNQVFVVVENTILEKLAPQVAYSFWEVVDAEHTAVRFASSWATTEEEVDELIQLLKAL